MAKTVAIGIQRFSEVREGNYFYIDKTGFIREWWNRGDSVTLITRPRRFGKTLTMSMVEQFFSLDYQDRGDLFEGLSIWEEEKYRELQGTYPVIFLSFANIKSTDFLSCKMEIFQIIVDLFEKHKYLLKDGIVEGSDADFYRSVSMTMPDYVAAKALHKLSDFLSRYYGRKVIILLDEYDTPMQEAYVHGFWDEIVSLLRSLFNSTFKTNPYLERAIMTGITRVSRESIFSDLNNPEIVTTTSDKYASCFGFTEEEVFQALDEYGYGDRKKEVKHWYDGFTIGNKSDIYNPWSILNFLDKGKIGTYWANTSSNGLIAKLIREGNQEIKSLFEELLQGKSIRCVIDEQIVFNQLDEDPDAIWSLLLASGYLKVLSYEQYDEIDDWAEPKYELALTNKEVRNMFVSMVRGWFKIANVEYNGFARALLARNLKEMNRYMNDVALKTFSYFDTGSHPSKEKSERFYHGFVLGLLVDLREDYMVVSNRESGYGRYDIMIEPKKAGTKPAYILEFKVFDKEEEQTLEDTVAAALAQIEEKQYEASLIARGIPAEHIYKYGFAFEGKRVLIGCAP